MSRSSLKFPICPFYFFRALEFRLYLGKKYLGVFSSRSLKMREKYISFTPLFLFSLYVYFLKEKCHYDLGGKRVFHNGIFRLPTKQQHSVRPYLEKYKSFYFYHAEVLFCSLLGAVEWLERSSNATKFDLPPAPRTPCTSTFLKKKKGSSLKTAIRQSGGNI